MNRKNPYHEQQVSRPQSTEPSESVFEDYPVASSHEDVEETGFLLVCAVDTCDCKKAFEDIDDIRESSWTQLTLPGVPLTSGHVLHESYCPAHSFPELDDREKDVSSDEFTPPKRTNRGGQQ